jgi:hypothetical protein
VEQNILNPNPGAPSPELEAAAAQPRKKTMSEAALAANRANALKSTGPRTPAGKARSASNAFQHGLYSMRNFNHLQGHPDLVATTIHNLLEEYQPVTPTEHILVQQLIHLQLRFIQMENFLNQFLHNGKHDSPDRAYLAVLRELDRIPARMLKTIKALRQLIAERGATPEIEPIEDPPPVLTPEEYMDSKNEPIHPTGPALSQSITEYIFREFCKHTNMDPDAIKPKSPPADPTL